MLTLSTMCKHRAEQGWGIKLLCLWSLACVEKRHKGEDGEAVVYSDNSPESEFQKNYQGLCFFLLMWIRVWQVWGLKYSVGLRRYRPSSKLDYDSCLQTWLSLPLPQFPISRTSITTLPFSHLWSLLLPKPFQAKWSKWGWKNFSGNQLKWRWHQQPLCCCHGKQSLLAGVVQVGRLGSKEDTAGSSVLLSVPLPVYFVQVLPVHPELKDFTVARAE